MSDILSIGINSLIAYQSALAISSQNIGNSNTKFYSRREVEFSEAMHNNGVNIADVRRIVDESSLKNLQRTTSIFAMSESSLDQLSQLEVTLGGDTNNTGIYINDTLKALRDLASDAGSLQSRTNFLNKLNILTNRFNTISGQLGQHQQNINQSLNTVVNSVNEIAGKIAEINKQVAATHGEENATLLDQRESLLSDLSKYIDFSTQQDQSGQINITLGNGSLLVFGSQPATLGTLTNPSDPNNLLITLTTGNSSVNVTDFIHGGQIAGLYHTQNVIQDTVNSLGRLSIGMMNEFNVRNKLGMDYNANLGGNIFTDINNSNLTSARAIANTNNAGSVNMDVTIQTPSSLTIDDYQLVFDTPTHYTLTRISTTGNSVVSSGTIGAFPQQISADGFTININSGSISAGDKFTISPTRNAASGMNVAISDSKQLALGWPVIATDSPQNTGHGAATVMSIEDTTNAAFSVPHQLSPPITIHFLSATQYELLDATNNNVLEGPISYTPGVDNDVFPTPGAYDPGYRVRLSGIINAGDTFNLDYNSNGAGDDRNGSEMEKLYQTKTLQGGSLTFSSAYDFLAGGVAQRTNDSKIGYVSSKAIMDQAYERYSQVSGVSVMEEYTNLARYQQSYQASAQVIEVAKSIFEIIIGLGR